MAEVSHTSLVFSLFLFSLLNFHLPLLTQLMGFYTPKGKQPRVPRKRQWEPARSPYKNHLSEGQVENHSALLPNLTHREERVSGSDQERGREVTRGGEGPGRSSFYSWDSSPAHWGAQGESRSPQGPRGSLSSQLRLTLDKGTERVRP